MSDVITTAEVRVCTAETINVAALDILNAYKAGVECSDEQLAILAKALCDSNRALKDYTAEQVSKVAEYSVSTNEKVVQLVKDLEQFKPLLDVLGDDSVESADKIDQLKALLNMLSSDVGVLQSLIAAQTELAATKAEVAANKAEIAANKADLQEVKVDVATLKDDVIALQDKSQSDVLCIVADSFANTAIELRKLVNCDARKTKLNEALACVTTPYTPVGEYQWAGNPADLAPSMGMGMGMGMPVLDTVVTPLTTDTATVDTVSPAMEYPTYVEPTFVAPTVEVVAPEVIVEPVFVVTSETSPEGVLFEVLSNGNMRKTDIDGTITTTNSMGDLV